MRKALIAILLLLVVSTAYGAENIRYVATWNMKWLGGSAGALDDTENIQRYVEHMKSTNASLFCLQEITPSHSVKGVVRCHYLNLILEELSSDGQVWTYYIDKKNGSQRLAFLYDASKWRLINATTIYPGSAYSGRLRDPLVGLFEAIGDNADFKFNVVNLHMKAFPDGDSKRKEQFDQLATWLATQTVDADVLICGDTNIYEDEVGTDSNLLSVGYAEVSDPEKTAIHNGQLNQRFDRFYASENLEAEVDSAKQIVGDEAYVDSLQEKAGGDFQDFDENVSDHFAVIVAVDVSEERQPD